MKFLIALFFPIMACAQGVVVEVLPNIDEQKGWLLAKPLHLTIAHLPDQTLATVNKGLDEFNRRNKYKLESLLKEGFVVGSFSDNGFNLGYKIILANASTKNRFERLNRMFYAFAIGKGWKMSEKTTPQFLLPAQRYFYIPHMEFLKKAPPFPSAGIIFSFPQRFLSARAL